MRALVGYTGFVGSNIYCQGSFDAIYNSKNISEAYGLKPDLLIYAGLRAEKYLANNFPEKDLDLIKEAEENIRKIRPKKLVLISTIDVLKKPNGVDETSDIITEGLHPYGLNRYYMEQWVQENYHDSLIIRLPGLFGRNLKKNFIYDFINRIPFMLTEQKMNELSEKDSELFQYYLKQDNGFYQCRALSNEEKVFLKEKFEGLGFSALNFTDSRSVYQFYPLERLLDDIEICLKEDIRIWHAATEPVSAAELYSGLTGGKEFVNYLSGEPANYDFKTLYASVFGGNNGYVCSKEVVIDMVKKFVQENLLKMGELV